MTHSDLAPIGSVTRFFQDMRLGGKTQANVIFALIFREIKNRSGQDGYGMLTLLAVMLEPALGVLALSAFWYFIRRQEIQGIHVALFLAVSFTAFAILRRSIASVPRTIRSNRSYYAFPNVKPIDAVVSRFILELTLTIVGGVVVIILVWWFIGQGILFNHLLEGLGIFLLLVMLAFGVCLFVGVYGTKFPLVYKGLQLSSRGLMFISAVMHPASELPPDAQYIISFNPVAHGMELFRADLLGTEPFSYVSLRYLVGCSMTALFIGLISYYPNRFKVIER